MTSYHQAWASYLFNMQCSIDLLSPTFTFRSKGDYSEQISDDRSKRGIVMLRRQFFFSLCVQASKSQHGVAIRVQLVVLDVT